MKQYCFSYEGVVFVTDSAGFSAVLCYLKSYLRVATTVCCSGQDTAALYKMY